MAAISVPKKSPVDSHWATPGSLTSTTYEEPGTNCFGCGRPLENVGSLPRHQPKPNAVESDRCTSRPRKYATLRCEHAAGHECVHRAKVSGTGLHYWRDDLAIPEAI